jgi:hypothetical protein
MKLTGKKMGNTAEKTVTAATPRKKIGKKKRNTNKSSLLQTKDRRGQKTRGGKAGRQGNKQKQSTEKKEHTAEESRPESTAHAAMMFIHS